MRRLPTALLLIALLLVPSVAHASGGARKLLIDACRDEKVNGTYTQKEYKQALEQLPADSDEYTACRQVIEAARLAALSNSKGGGSGNGGAATGGSAGGGGSSGAAGAANPLATASPSERKAIAKAGRTATAVDIAGEPVRPGTLGLGGLSGSGRDLPTALIALIALLALAVLAAGGWWLRTVVVARRLR
ncbi:MAG: hypothetical protein QOC78_1728 [Solirubrobacteraceae bacterium]|jgi:hypothetical protein|nr:hypothetical protein [Solirubrobacteraceae bacterium]